MKKLYCFIVLLSLVTTALVAQSLDWASQFSSDRGVSVSDMSSDASGNLYLCGTFGTGVGNPADFDPGPNVFELVGLSYISKLDASGNLVWAKSFNGFGPSVIRTDSSGNVYVGFTLDGTVDVDPGAGVLNLTANGLGDIVFLKFDSNGILLWAKQIGGSSSDSVDGMSIGSDGSIYSTGYFSQTTDFDPGVGTANLTAAGSFDIFALKLDSNGDFNWAQQIGGGGLDYGESLLVDSNNEVYFIGEFTGVVDFDHGSETNNLTSQGSRDIFICKLDESGNFIWAGNMGADDFQLPTSLYLANDDQIYIAGTYEGTGDFDPGIGVSTLTSTGEQDAFVAKISKTTGDLTWVKVFNGTRDTVLPSVVVDNEGTIYTVGGLSGTTDFDPGSEEFNLEAESIVDFDIFISRLDSDGNFECARLISGLATELPYRLLITSAGQLVISGIFEDEVDFDPGPNVTTLTNVGDSFPFSDNEADVFIVQLGIETCPNLSISEIDVQQNIEIFPNPISDYLNINLNTVYSQVDIRVIDMEGRIVFSNLYNKLNTISLPMTQYASGMYLVEVNIEGKSNFFRVIKQ